MKISIAMATYNGECFIKEQLESFVWQTRKPNELVVCDDGSTDHTYEILEHFAQRAPFEVRLFRNLKNLGYTKNFERAIDLSKGQIIFLSDQDDVWFPDKIERVSERFMIDSQSLIIINDAEITDGSLNRTGLSIAGQIHSAGLSQDHFITGCCTAFRAELKSLILPIPDTQFAHDTWIHRLGLVLQRRVLIPEPLQFYRRHGHNTSQWFTNSTKRVTSLDMFARYAKKDSRVWCARRQEALEVLHRRLMEKGREVEELLGGSLHLKGVFTKIEVERSVIQQREALLRRGRLFRSLKALRMYLSGGYSYFSGWKSFIKDLIQ